MKNSLKNPVKVNQITLRSMTQQRSTFSLIGERYLDTQFSRTYIESIDHELRKRGVYGNKRALLELVAAGGLCWNVLWWEWSELDGSDIWRGWLYNLFIAAFIFGSLAYCVSWRVAIPAVCVFVAYAIWTGISLRRGAIADDLE